MEEEGSSSLSNSNNISLTSLGDVSSKNPVSSWKSKKLQRSKGRRQSLKQQFNKLREQSKSISANKESCSQNEIPNKFHTMQEQSKSVYKGCINHGILYSEESELHNQTKYEEMKFEPSNVIIEVDSKSNRKIRLEKGPSNPRQLPLNPTLFHPVLATNNILEDTKECYDRNFRHMHYIKTQSRCVVLTSKPKSKETYFHKSKQKSVSKPLAKSNSVPKPSLEIIHGKVISDLKTTKLPVLPPAETLSKKSHKDFSALASLVETVSSGSDSNDSFPEIKVSKRSKLKKC